MLLWAKRLVLICLNLSRRKHQKIAQAITTRKKLYQKSRQQRLTKMMWTTVPGLSMVTMPKVRLWKKLIWLSQVSGSLKPTSTKLLTASRVRQQVSNFQQVSQGCFQATVQHMKMAILFPLSNQRKRPTQIVWTMAPGPSRATTQLAPLSTSPMLSLSVNGPLKLTSTKLLTASRAQRQVKLFQQPSQHWFQATVQLMWMVPLSQLNSHLKPPTQIPWMTVHGRLRVTTQLAPLSTRLM